jgi:glycosyltransferase involved in cell wall biosynthesis/peptidoglycan/xylan/chitin deacetylase (PgdA/CDA1 family)
VKGRIQEIADSPRVSVITPFLNNEAFLSETIESVVAQTFNDWEYLLVDDGSGPAATSIAKRYAARFPGRIRYLEHPEHLNRGISATRNLGVRNAHGEFIAFLDSDDIWLPSKLAEHVALLDAHQAVGMVCGTTVEWNSWSKGPDCILPTGHRQDVVVYPPDATIELYPLGNARAPSFSDVVFRAELVRRLGGFEEQFTELYDDQVLLSKVYLSTPVYFSSTTSNKYRQHPASICATATKEEGLQSKLDFLEWLEQYLRTIDTVDPRVASSLHRRLRPYRSPRIHYLLSVISKSRMVGRLRIRTRLRSVIRRIRPPKPKPLILLYHRIADEPVDPWGLAVSPAHFEEHLRLLRRTRHPLPLVEFVRGLQEGTLPPNAVAVTFDDGYVDNLVYGKPRLAAADVPATVFLTTGYLNSSREFWWDELASLLLLGDGPKNIELMVRGQPVQFEIGGNPPAHQDANTPAASLNMRQAALMTVWKVLRHLGDEERELAMRILRSNFAVTDRHGLPGRGMTNEEVKALVADELVTIGAHTVTHPALPSLEAGACRREIAESKLACEALIGAPVSTFAYPYGDFDANVRKEVRSAGFAIACSTKRGPLVATSDGFALPRFYAPNVGGDAFEQALRLASVAN